MIKLFNKYNKTIDISEVCYTSIHDLSIYLFDKISNNEDYTLLIKAGKKYKGDLEEVWSKIYDEYLNEFGINEKYKDYLNAKIKEAELIVDFRVNDNKVSKTLAKVKAAEANSILENMQGGSLRDACAAISKYMGFMVDPIKTSVYTFISYIKLMNSGKGKA